MATDLADGRARNAGEVRELTRLSDHKDLGFVVEDLSRLTADQTALSQVTGDGGASAQR